MIVQEQEKYMILKAENGFVLTSWREDDDILNYNSYRTVYAPKNADLSIYREITEESNKSYEKEQLEKIKYLNL